MADSADTEALRKDFEQLRKDFAALSENVKSRSNDQVNSGINKAYESLDGMSSELQSRPFTLMLSAFGIGLLLGKVFSR